MHTLSRMFTIAVVFVAATISWMILAGVIQSRTRDQDVRFSDDVNSLWGKPQVQAAPTLVHAWQTSRLVDRTETTPDGKSRRVRERVEETHTADVAPASSVLDVDVRLDQRLRGLLWYSLYDVGFDGAWTYEHREPTAGTLRIGFRFPDAEAVYDDFRFVVDGVNLADRLHPTEGELRTELPVVPGQVVRFAVAYKSRGRDQWAYQPVGKAVDGLRDFKLRLHTDFKDIDYPLPSMSPSARTESERGWTLDWAFHQVYTGHVMGVVTPKRIQPGELAAQLSFTAPISLLFFFLLVFVLSVLRKLDIHPINYAFLAGAFVSFHLLFSYSVDRLPLWASFAIASTTSLILVVSYLRLVVSPRFAYREAAAAQLVYQVGFSLAHFADGYTGLTVSILATVTLFVLMQLTGRVRWSQLMTQAART